MELKRRLKEAIENACREGMEHFLSGMARGCDLYCAELTLEVKERWPGITLEAALPCPTQSEGWPQADRQRWEALLDRCDYVTMVQDHYSRGCMLRRDRYMVDHASLLIAVYDGLGGGTRHTVEYALRQNTPVVFVPPVGQ
jgi:uncharacterized phage-like protein YoqJ